MRTHSTQTSWGLLGLVALLAAGCAADGPKGEAGQDGEDGAAGEDGQDNSNAGEDGQDGQDGDGFDALFTGVVLNAAGPAAGAPVALSQLTSDGAWFGNLAGTLTGDDGSFSLHLANVSEPGLQLMLSADTRDGTLTALVSADDVTVDAASTAVTQTISWIVASEDGRSLSDYSAQDYDSLVAGADAALTAAGADLSDLDAVQELVLSELGSDIADASGGSWSAAAASVLVSTEPADVYRSGDGSAFETLYDGLGETWDIYTSDGYIFDGSDDAYDGWASLQVDGSSWRDGSRSYGIEDGLEWVAQVTDLGGGGLDVTRKVYVSPDYGFARHTELLDNPGAGALTVDVRVSGLMGSDENNDWFSLTSSGDIDYDDTDQWATNRQDLSDPALGWVFPGAELSKRGAEVFLDWPAVTVPAGGRVTLSYWSLQRSVQSVDALGELLAAEVSTSTGAPVQAYWYGGMSSQEAIDNVVPLIGTNLVGGAGAVAPWATLTLTNDDTGVSTSTQAASDGSFTAGIPAESGHGISLSGTDGSSEVVYVP